jgi:hypothetical protein
MSQIKDSMIDGAAQLVAYTRSSRLASVAVVSKG